MSESDNANSEFIPHDDQESHGGLVRPDQILPETLHLIPLTSRPFFPESSTWPTSSTTA